MAAFNDRALLRTKDATGNGDGGAAVKPTNSLGSPNRRRLWGSKASVGLWPMPGTRSGEFDATLLTFKNAS